MPWRSKLFRELEARPEDSESILQRVDRNICRLEGAERKKFFEEARNRFPDIYGLTAFNDRGESVEALRTRQEQLWGGTTNAPQQRKPASKQQPNPSHRFPWRPWRAGRRAGANARTKRKRANMTQTSQQVTREQYARAEVERQARQQCHTTTANAPAAAPSTNKL